MTTKQNKFPSLLNTLGFSTINKNNKKTKQENKKEIKRQQQDREQENQEREYETDSSYKSELNESESSIKQNQSSSSNEQNKLSESLEKHELGENENTTVYKNKQRTQLSDLTENESISPTLIEELNTDSSQYNDKNSNKYKYNKTSKKKNYFPVSVTELTITPSEFQNGGSYNTEELLKTETQRSQRIQRRDEQDTQDTQDTDDTDDTPLDLVNKILKTMQHVKNPSKSEEKIFYYATLLKAKLENEDLNNSFLDNFDENDIDLPVTQISSISTTTRLETQIQKGGSPDKKNFIKKQHRIIPKHKI